MISANMNIICMFFYVLGGDGYDNLANAYCHVQLSKFKTFITISLKDFRSYFDQISIRPSRLI